MAHIPTILATAYSVNPYKGSEDGMGWNFVSQIAKKHKTYCITRKNNKGPIEDYISKNPDPIYDRLTFLYFDLPYWQRFWKRKEKGALIYYWLWQWAIPRFVKSQNINFDISHNLNFHNDWTPSYLWKLGKPFVWGPIGHHPATPVQYLRHTSLRYRFINRLTWLVKRSVWKFSLSLKATIRNADFIYVMNSSVEQVLPLQNKNHSIKPSVATEDHGYSIPLNQKEFTVISAGRLVPLKGFDLTLKSFAGFVTKINVNERKKCRLKIIGKGPEEHRLKELITLYGVEDCVEIIPWLERDKLLAEMKSASVFLFPSHEGAGMVVAEALSFALPVICLQNVGPGELVDSKCAIIVPEQSYQETVDGLSHGLNTLFSNQGLYFEMRLAARKKFEKAFDWNRWGDWLNHMYLQLR